MTTHSLITSQSPQDRLGRAIAARLQANAHDVPHDVAERLKAARVLALSRRHVAVAAAASAQVSGGTAALLGGPEHLSLWERMGSVLPLLALVAGLMLIGVVQEDQRARELAEVDSALLVDELPPDAFSDPGFAHFLHANQSN